MEEKKILTETNNLYGLVLAGGQSRRMKQDKSLMAYHDIPQAEYTYRLLSPFFEQTFISCREDQKNNFNPNCHLIFDRYDSIGPIGGLLSAFEKHPDSSFFVLPCDMPYLTQEEIKTVLQKRSPYKKGSYVFNASTKNIEPLFCIYEPSSHPLVKKAVQEKEYSLRKLILKYDFEKVILNKKDRLMNINE